jgi:hypothetical protein
MIVDNTLVLSDSQAVTATAGRPTSSTSARPGRPWRFGGDGLRHWQGTDIPIMIEVTEAFATLTSLTFSLETTTTRPSRRRRLWRGASGSCCEL